MTQTPPLEPASGTSALMTSTRSRPYAGRLAGELRRQLYLARLLLLSGRVVACATLGVSAGLAMAGNTWAVPAAIASAFTVGLSIPAQLYVAHIRLRFEGVRDGWSF